MNKNQERLLNSICIICEIECSKCGVNSKVFLWDDYMFAEYLEKEGWYSTVNNVYCPECNNKRIRNRNNIK